MCLLSICMSRLGRQVYSSLRPTHIQVLMLSCLSSLCMLDINPVSDISFANIFSHPVGSPFHFVGWLFPLLHESFFFCYSPICLLFLLLFPLPEDTYQKNMFLRLMSSGMLSGFLPEILWFQIF